MKCVQYPMTLEQKYEIIDFFYDQYYNTNQDVETFAQEFYFLTGHILLNRIPLELKKIKHYEYGLRKILPRLFEDGETIELLDE